LTEGQKDKLGNFLAVCIFILCILFGYGFIVGSDIMMWFIIIVNFIFGPICFIFYLIEVKRGIFSADGIDE
jgi:Flp pilus assembly protein TadB